MSISPPPIDAVTAEQVATCNQTGRTPVVFIHGLWLLPSSWDRWAAIFEDNGYTALTPGWPDDPETVTEANAHPDVLAAQDSRSGGRPLRRRHRPAGQKPALVGHSFGGLLAQILAGRGLSAATVAIDPAPFRGVLPLPISALRSASPVLHNPSNRNRAVPLTYEQFRYGFANAVTEEEAKQLYDAYAVPAPGAPLFQAASANFNPWTEAKVDSKNPERGPLLIISGEKDHTVPWSIANASYKKQKRNQDTTEITEIPGRGHSLTIDNGWRDVAETALTSSNVSSSRPVSRTSAHSDSTGCRGPSQDWSAVPGVRRTASSSVLLPVDDASQAGVDQGHVGVEPPEARVRRS